MDPNEALKQLLEELSGPNRDFIDRGRCIELLDAQVEWLRNGGFYPTVANMNLGVFKIGEE